MGGEKDLKFGAIAHKNWVDFTVWAPNAEQVWVNFGTQEKIWEDYEMVSTTPGIWETKIGEAKPGMGYQFKILTKTGDILYKNDPYARQLSDSDTGNGIIIDQKFKWGIRGFNSRPHREQVIYEMHIGTFNKPNAYTSGTFATALEKLDYLKRLGINTIELMPVTAMSGGNGWGYEPKSIFAIENQYGGRAGLLEFVRKCHNNGIAVILDVVYNHFSEADLWNFDGSENIYFFKDENKDTPWGARPNYNDKMVQKFFLDNVQMWIEEFHLDGLRIDSTLYMRNRDGHDNAPETDVPGAWELFQKINTFAHKLNKNFLMIAEDWGSNEWLTKPISEGGAGFDAQWNNAVPYELRDTLNKGNLSTIKDAILASNFRKVNFSDSHDTAANGGARLNEELTDHDLARAEMLLANAIILMMPGIPMLLQGEEFMQPGSFNAWQPLEWQRSNFYHGIVLAHQHLIDLRRNKYGNTPGLLTDEIEIFHFDEQNDVIGFKRGETYCLANFGKTNFASYKFHLSKIKDFTIRFNSTWNGYDLQFANNLFDVIRPNDSGEVEIELTGYQFILWS